MKSAAKVGLVGAICFLTGTGCGVVLAIYVSSIFQSDAAYSRFISDATFQLAVLEKLHEGNPSAAEAMLSTELNGNLAALDPSDSRISNVHRELTKKLFSRFDDYREHGSPRRSE